MDYVDVNIFSHHHRVSIKVYYSRFGTVDRVYSEAAIIVNVGLAGFLVVASSAASIVLAQTMLPNNVGMAAGLTIGFSVGLGGLGVTGLGVLADNMGLPFTMQTMTVLTALGALVAFKLPIPESLRKKF